MSWYLCNKTLVYDTRSCKFELQLIFFTELSESHLGKTQIFSTYFNEKKYVSKQDFTMLRYSFKKLTQFELLLSKFGVDVKAMLTSLPYPEQ